jgi:hypothetical protein
MSEQDFKDLRIDKIEKGTKSNNPVNQKNPANHVQTMVQVEIKGLDIYDPIKEEVKPRNVHDIAYWMMDDNYDGSNLVVK